jgi:Spherulation-specific family 4
LVVPAYFGPWERHHWAMLVQARPSVVVINPASGPGHEPQSDYRPLVEQLQRNGTTVLGYVTTSWLTRSTPECAADAHTYVDTYGTSGVLYDEVPSEVSALEHLTRLVAESPNTVVFNPGRQIPSRFRSALPNATWVTFEGTARQYLERHSGNQKAHAADWHLVHSVAASVRPQVLRTLQRNNPGHAYVTADRMPNPWDVFDPSGFLSTK